MRLCKLGLVLGFTSLATTSLANGAMGLALEVFDFRIWAVYVVATIVLEAWIIGRYLEHGWLKSLALSLVFNAGTAFCCAGGLFAPFLHADTIDTNPFLRTVVILAIFGAISGWVESILWRFTARQRPQGRVIGRSMVAHALGVPLALVILLLPNRPYVGYEASVGFWREQFIRFKLRHVYDDRVDGDKVRQFRNVQELEKALDAEGGYGVCLYRPVYHRFDFYDHRTSPLLVELNQQVDFEKEGHTWLVRIHYPYQTVEYDPAPGQNWHPL